MSHNTDKLIAFYNSHEYHKYQALQKRETLFDIIGKSDKEYVHTSLITWIFGNKEFNNLPEHPVLFLLRLYAKKTTTNNTKLCETIKLGAIKVSDVSVGKEKSISNGRLDLFITCKIDANDSIIVIENKVNSKEHNKQCKTYENHFKNRPDLTNKVYIYLSPNEDEGISSNEFVKITYQEFYDYVLSPIMDYRGQYTERTYTILKEYIDTVTSIKNRLAMAEDDAKLLKKFFENNKDLIIAACQASGDGDVVEMATKLEKAVSIKFKYKLPGKNSSLIDNNGNGFSKAGIIFEVVKYVLENKDDGVKVLKDTAWEGIDSKCLIVNVSETNTSYSKKTVVAKEDNQEYCITNQTKKASEFKNFFKQFKDKFGIKIEEL